MPRVGCGAFFMENITVEYELTHDGRTPDNVIIAAIMKTPFEMTLHDPQGETHMVTLTPSNAYPSSLSA